TASRNQARAMIIAEKPLSRAPAGLPIAPEENRNHACQQCGYGGKPAVASALRRGDLLERQIGRGWRRGELLVDQPRQSRQRGDEEGRLLAQPPLERPPADLVL